jgi:carbon starvation protein
VWLKRTGRRNFYVVIPMLFMFAVTLLALVQLVIQRGASVIGVIAAFLLVLAVVLIVEAVRAWGGEVVADSDDAAGDADESLRLEGGKV